jgi:DNA (cytosine-5)-methyltransferase 1
MANRKKRKLTNRVGAPSRPRTKRQSRSFSAGALFGGIGGFCLAFEAAGFHTAWANDADPYACSVYRTNFPDNRLIEKDVRKLSVVKDMLKPVDVLHAGFPCQSFSQAGTRTGFDDERMFGVTKRFGLCFDHVN